MDNLRHYWGKLAAAHSYVRSNVLQKTI